MDRGHAEGSIISQHRIIRESGGTSATSAISIAPRPPQRGRMQRLQQRMSANVSK